MLVVTQAPRGAPVAALAAVSEKIWALKYRLANAAGAPIEQSIEDSWDRVQGHRRRVPVKIGKQQTEFTRFVGADDADAGGGIEHATRRRVARVVKSRPW